MRMKTILFERQSKLLVGKPRRKIVTNVGLQYFYFPTSFHILRSLAAIFQAFIREQLFTFPFLDFPQTVFTCTILSDRPL